MSIMASRAFKAMMDMQLELRLVTILLDSRKQFEDNRHGYVPPPSYLSELMSTRTPCADLANYVPMT